ncbi:hypothetical protein SLS62_010709 [Diatrype stigma]|uniref:Arrestin-like N-terminal domain-containing protein n=1 Tax=Diatrype stigma TaxID=117547 RepID=A0AAN9U8D5_9PEZI
MSNGSLTATIVLDKPDHVHCGSHDPVTGNVCLRYRPPPLASADAAASSSSTELFGPLRVTIRLHGRAKTKIKRDKEYDRGRVPLFSMARLVYDGPLRLAAGAVRLVPFAVRFPDTVAPTAAQVQAFPRCFDARDARFDTAPDQPLPPAMSTAYHGFTQTFECFVEYRLGAAVAMPGMHVSVHCPRDEDGPLIAYDRALPPPLALTTTAFGSSGGIDPRPHRLGGTIRVQSKHLLPEADRPRGFRAKTKAALNPTAYYPVAVFGWSCAVPTQVCRDENATVPITVRAWPRFEESTAASAAAAAGGGDAKMAAMPEVRLLRCAVRVTAHTRARAEIHFVSCHDAEGHEDVAFWSSRPDPTPFREADGWTKTLGSVTLGRRVPSSFRTVNIARYYRMHVGLAFALPGGETRDFKDVFSLDVLPPLARAQTEAQAPPLAPAVAEDPMPMYTAALAAEDPISPPAYEEVAKPPKYTAAPT